MKINPIINKTTDNNQINFCKFIEGSIVKKKAKSFDEVIEAFVNRDTLSLSDLSKSLSKKDESSALDKAIDAFFNRK